MRWALAIVCLLSGQAVNLAGVGDENEHAGRVPNESGVATSERIRTSRTGRPLRDERGSGAVATIEQIRNAWAEREAAIPAAAFEWRILRRSQSKHFGSLRRTEPSDGEPSPEELVRLSLSGGRIRLEARSVPTLAFGEVGTVSRPRFWQEGFERDIFLAALEQRFEEPVHVDAPQPLLVLIDPAREQYIWRATESTYGRAAILPSGSSRLVFDSGASNGLPCPLPFVSASVDALRLAMRPAALLANEPAGEARVLPQSGVFDGRLCSLIEFPLNLAREDGTCRVWVDGSPRRLVVRCVLSGEDGTARRQYDIEYDRPEGETRWPSRLSAVQLSRSGYVRDELVLVRRSFEREPDFAPAIWSWDPPPDTWVADEIANRQFYVRVDGARQPIAMADMASGLTIDDLRPHANGTGVLAYARRIGGWLVPVVLGLFAWPTILLTLPGLYGAYLLGRVGLGRVKASRTSSSSETPSL